MNINILLFFTLSFAEVSVLAMQVPQVVVRQANQADLPELLELINTQAIHDYTKIVILPRKFREASLCSAIAKKRIFVATDRDKIVGYKKLFAITDDAEKAGILKDEIRCVDNEKNCEFSGQINADGAFVADQSPMPDDCYHTCIYNGGDFTLPAYRGKGINQQLTNFALLSLTANIKPQMQQNKLKALTMLYGITQANAGERPGAPSDRTVSISKSFKSFIQNLEGRPGASSLYHRRYRAFMPTFDPEAQELRPLPDVQSIPGYGCLLTYQLKGLHE